ncbi:hypothetical protein BCR39DRAFT_80019 [Naematelia encephala]|uniref:Uncharacterized protein n=1 Tax=Naematelia encephala TaxID=71784 RepID=A0A1Y2BAL7_9TREE|nr:hypothetical protein BCR39DRAFT_80019 [Naematelia encephala]
MTLSHATCPVHIWYCIVSYLVGQYRPPSWRLDDEKYVKTFAYVNVNEGMTSVCKSSTCIQGHSGTLRRGDRFYFFVFPRLRAAISVVEPFGSNVSPKTLCCRLVDCILYPSTTPFTSLLFTFLPFPPSTAHTPSLGLSFLFFHLHMLAWLVCDPRLRMSYWHV